MSFGLSPCRRTSRRRRTRVPCPCPCPRGRTRRAHYCQAPGQLKGGWRRWRRLFSPFEATLGSRALPCSVALGLCLDDEVPREGKRPSTTTCSILWSALVSLLVPFRTVQWPFSPFLPGCSGPVGTASGISPARPCPALARRMGQDSLRTMAKRLTECTLNASCHY